jgi:hypothetical protein
LIRFGIFIKNRNITTGAAQFKIGMQLFLTRLIAPLIAPYQEEPFGRK